MNESKQRYVPAIVFCVLGLIWGCNFIYMKMASTLITPDQIAFFRVLFGFSPVLLYAIFTRAFRRAHARHIGHFAVMAFLTATYYYSFAKGTSMLYSGVAGIVSGGSPIISFLLTMAFLKEEKLSFKKAVGIMLGFVGLALVARPSAEQLLSSNMQAVLYMLAGILSVGSSFVYTKKFITPLKIKSGALTAYQMGLALIFLACFTNYKGIGNIWTEFYPAVGIVVGLGLLGTGAAFIMYYYVIDKLGAVTASSATYIPPIVALFIGVLIANESIECMDYLAAALVFAGVFLLRRKK